MAVPDAIATATRSRGVENPIQRPPSRSVSRGDVRLIAPPYDGPGDSQLGLVLNVDNKLQFIEIALVHPYPELATSMDAVVPATLAGTPFDVVVETDLRGVVWTPVQVSRLVGRLSSETLEAISDLIETGEPESPTGIRIGTRLTGTHDRRWAFKAAEGAALDLLTADCTGEVIDGRSPWRVDPELFVPELLAASLQLDVILVELVHWLETRSLRLTVEDALLLEDRGALEFEAWREARLSTDLYEALIDIVEEALTKGRSAQSDGPMLSKFVAAPYSPPAAHQHAERVHTIGTLARSKP